MAPRQLGQHWLFDKTVLQTIVELAHLDGRDTVLEVGPGPGALTEQLAASAREVIAVELDPDLSERLQEQQLSNVAVINHDILHYDLRSLPTDYKVVANIPYSITSRLLRQLWSGGNQPTLAVLLLQKEVAERVCASAGNMSVLSFSVQFYAEVELHQTVAKNLFTPPPEVDSAIVRMRRRSHPYFAADEKLLFRLVKAGFSERRKKLVNALSGGLHLPKPTVTTLLVESGIELDARAQQLSMDDWKRLYEVATAKLQT